MADLDPALTRALLAARDKREQRGAGRDGRIVVVDLTAEEALALDGLLDRRKPVLPGTDLRGALSAFEAALRACGADPLREYERAGGRPVRDLPAERASRLELREGFRSWLASHEVVKARPGIGAWLQDAAAQGRIHVELQPVVEQALRVVAALPAPATVQRTVLAARVLGGDPHALDVGTPLHTLTTSLLSACTGLDPDTPARAIWAAAGVLVDPISSNVAVLNLPLLGDGVAARLCRQLRGTHAILTFGQLAADELRWPPGAACFSCENPSVLIAAERSLGSACPPLVCTAGRPSDAVRLLFSAIHRAGGEIRHHGDTDDAGVQIFGDLHDRYGAVPWRFDTTRRCDPVPEELVIDELLEDLHRAQSARTNLAAQAPDASRASRSAPGRTPSPPSPSPFADR